MAEILTSALEIKLNRVHLLSEKNLQQLRRTLRADEKVWPNERLHRHVDELAINVGLRRKMESQIPAAKRIQHFERNFIAPAEILVKAVADREFTKEFYQAWGGFSGFDFKSFEQSLTAFLAGSRNHSKILKRSSTSGKGWDNELKDRFVELVSMLCEYVDPTFEPKRKSQFGKEENAAFRDIVRMLGQPIFGDVDFDGAIRKLVDRWNSNKKEMITKITKRKEVAEKITKS